jgi:hypothetical protein
VTSFVNLTFLPVTLLLFLWLVFILFRLGWSLVTPGRCNVITRRGDTHKGLLDRFRILTLIITVLAHIVIWYLLLRRLNGMFPLGRSR